MTEVEATYIPTQDERTMALLAHVLQLVGWWIAPLIIFMARRQSRFVSFHALQALLLQGVHVALILFAFFAVFGGGFFFAVTSSLSGGAAPLAALFIPLVFLSFAGIGVTIWVLAIVYGIKASRGEWAEYPILGKWARQILNMGPNGTAM